MALSNNVSNLTGYFKAIPEKRIAFASQGFHFNLITPQDPYEAIYGDTIKIDPQGGFIFGYDHSGHPLAIYGGEKRILMSTNHLPIVTGFIARGEQSGEFEKPIDSFDEMCFTGGTLNDLCYAMLDTETTENGLVALVSPLKNSLGEGEILVDEQPWQAKLELVAGKGKSQAKLDYRFDIRLTLTPPATKDLKVVFRINEAVKRTLAFMVFRQNVSTGEIFIRKRNDDGETFIKTASCYFRNAAELEDAIFLHWDKLTLDDLGTSFFSLISFMANDSVGGCGYNMSIYPENDGKFGKMSNERIRNVCTAIEYEVGSDETLAPEENAELGELIDGVKKFVKKYRKDQESILSNETYNLISCDIDRWSLTNAESIQLAVDKYRKLIDIYLKRREWDYIDISVKEFVQYRNKIAHKDYLIPTLEVAKTATILTLVVYIYVLESIGITLDTIEEFLNNDKLICHSL